jgi:hypothetical protein
LKFKRECVGVPACKEDVVLEVTNSAVENLKNYLSQNNIDSAVRIALMQGG